MGSASSCTLISSTPPPAMCLESLWFFRHIVLPLVSMFTGWNSLLHRCPPTAASRTPRSTQGRDSPKGCVQTGGACSQSVCAGGGGGPASPCRLQPPPLQIKALRLCVCDCVKGRK